MTAANDPIASLPGLSPVIEARFDEALMSSDSGLLALPDVLRLHRRSAGNGTRRAFAR